MDRWRRGDLAVNISISGMMNPKSEPEMSLFVIPAQAGIRAIQFLEPGFREADKNWANPKRRTSCEISA